MLTWVFLVGIFSTQHSLRSYRMNWIYFNKHQSVTLLAINRQPDILEHYVFIDFCTLLYVIAHYTDIHLSYIETAFTADESASYTKESEKNGTMKFGLLEIRAKRIWGNEKCKYSLLKEIQYSMSLYFNML